MLKLIFIALFYFINLKNKFVESFSVKLKSTKGKYKNFKY